MADKMMNCPICGTQVAAARRVCPCCLEELQSGPVILSAQAIEADIARQEAKRRAWQKRDLPPRPRGNVEPSSLLLARLADAAPDRLAAVAWSPDGRRVAAGGYGGTCWLWPAVGGEPHRLRGCRTRVTCLAFNQAGDQLIAGSGGWQGWNPIWRWDTGRARLLATGPVVEQTVLGLALGQSGQALATVSGGWRGSGNQVRIWNLDDNSVLHTFDRNQAAIACLAWSPVEPLLALGSGGWGSDNTVLTWQPEQNRLLLMLVGHSAALAAVAFSGDGRYLASGGHDGSVRVWDSSSGQQLATFCAGGWIAALAWQPQGELLAAACYDRTVRVWGLTGEREPLVLEGHTGPVTGVAWKPDGLVLASSAWDGHVILWRVDA